MHEYSLVMAMMKQVQHHAALHHATKIHRLFVRIGQHAGVERELFGTAFEIVRRGTICADAELVMVREATEWACPSCGQRIETGDVLVCPHCEWPAQLAGGDALVLERIEMEVP
jgi:hydrogenase nickel incorporation protein HypA/HybF